jgi:plastocyanin
MRARIMLVVVTLLVLLTACGGDDSKGDATDTTAKPATAATPSGGTITIKSFAFTPSPLTAKTGDSIKVTNEDGTNHSVTADDGSFDTDPFDSGTKTISLTKAGTIAYHCKIHSSMKGVIQVSS